jgi:hypothetical protein
LSMGGESNHPLPLFQASMRASGPPGLGPEDRDEDDLRDQDHDEE